MAERLDVQVAVVGGGPAGIAAAVAAAGVLGPGRVALLDDNAVPGGQIWRGDPDHKPPAARRLLEKLDRSGVEVISGAAVVDARTGAATGGTLFADQSDRLRVVAAPRLVLALGAIERFLPFPGWTLPGVVGAGGLQALVKSGLEVRGKRVVVAGSGPLLLAVAALLREHGAAVVALVEQASWGDLARFGGHALREPGKWGQMAALGWRTATIPRRCGAWPLRALGESRLEGVVIGDAAGGEHAVPCDLLAVGFGLVPHTALARLLGCRVEGGRVAVDDQLETSRPGIFAAGEVVGIGGVERALLDGELAGRAAAGRPDARLARRRRRSRAFGAALERCFALREELRLLADDATQVCRCEDVAWGEVRRHFTARDAKLKTRCGMGPCQGRVCGGALEFLAGFAPDTVRPPLYPVSLRLLAELAAANPEGNAP